MDDSLRPRRSVLYLPASNARALEKAKTIPCDALIFDLEDAVAPDQKAAAREQAAAAAGARDHGDRELTIRCNGLDTPWGRADIAAAAAAGPSGVVLPKVSGVAQLADVASALERSGAPDHTRIWAMVETPAAIFAAREIASFDRVAVLVMGTNDLAKELRAAQTPARHALAPHLATAVLAARAEGKVSSGRRVQRHRRPRRIRSRVPPGLRDGLRRQDADPSSQVEPCNRVVADCRQIAHA
jgi:citrate lyase subunit beta/citryl-CoA lyase